jgi:hypothetical protein
MFRWTLSNYLRNKGNLSRPAVQVKVMICRGASASTPSTGHSSMLNLKILWLIRKAQLRQVSDFGQAKHVV